MSASKRMVRMPKRNSVSSVTVSPSSTPPRSVYRYGSSTDHRCAAGTVRMHSPQVPWAPLVATTFPSLATMSKAAPVPPRVSYLTETVAVPSAATSFVVTNTPSVAKQRISLISTVTSR